MNPPDTLKQRILEAAQKRPVPVRVDRTPRARALIGFAALAMTAVFLLMGGPAHAAGRPAPYAIRVIGGTVALAALATWIMLPRRKSMLPPSRAQLWSVIVGIPIAIGVWTMVWHTAYADPFEKFGWRCAALTLATAPWPFVALTYLRDRIDPVHPSLTGAASGAVAGVWAAVMAAMWCPLSEPGHVLRGHVAPVVLLAAVGAVLGARLFRLRRV